MDIETTARRIALAYVYEILSNVNVDELDTFVGEFGIPGDSVIYDLVRDNIGSIRVTLD